jgi:hypothetical protein
MKTNPLRHILIFALGTTIVLGLLFYIRNSLKSSIATPKEGIPNPLPLADFARESNRDVHVAESDRLSTVSSVQQRVTSVTNGPGVATAHPKSKSATSPSGEHAEISPDGRRVTLTDKSGHVIWSQDIVAPLGRICRCILPVKSAHRNSTARVSYFGLEMSISKWTAKLGKQSHEMRVNCPSFCE